MIHLLITIIPISVEPHICSELWYELERGVEERLITQKQADRIFNACLQTHLRPLISGSNWCLFLINC